LRGKGGSGKNGKKSNGGKSAKHGRLPLAMDGEITINRFASMRKPLPGLKQ
jgi:hypothetical protein